MPDRDDLRLIERYLAGECTAAEASLVRERLGREPDLVRTEALLRRIRVGVSPAPGPYDSMAAWETVRSRMDPPVAGDRPSATQIRPTAVRRRGPRSTLVRAAAVAFLALGAGYAWLATAGADAGRVAAPPPRAVETEAGQRAAVRLADGTTVVLAPGSRLVEAGEFGRRERRVELVGEAFFEVASDPRRPFVVVSRGAVTRVLGTSFGIRAYGDEGSDAVIVRSGRVEVTGTGPTGGTATVLTAGHVATVRGDGGIVVRDDHAIDQYLAWTSGLLVFRDAPLADVVQRISAWHGVPIRLEDQAVADRLVTATFGTESLSEVLDLLERSLDLDITTHDGAVGVRARGARL